MYWRLSAAVSESPIGGGVRYNLPDIAVARVSGRLVRFCTLRP